ncbi:MAG TPA: hypothetical protein VMR73_00935 [Candidatus Paceibacterota bacterium]|nr:hypothetical protein [Candidatus Paceibacterota bacterium]
MQNHKETASNRNLVTRNNKISSFFGSWLLAVGFLLVFISSSHIAYAQQTQPFTVVPLTTLPGLTTAGTAVNPTTYIQGLYAFAISIGVVIAVLSGVYAGIEYMLSESSFTTKEKAIKRIQNVGWGALLLLSSYLLLDLINPQLVQWNLNLGTINNSQLQGDVTADNTALAEQQAQAAYNNNAVTATQAAIAAQSIYQDDVSYCNSPEALGDDTCDTSNPNSQISLDADTVITANTTQMIGQTTAAIYRAIGQEGTAGATNTGGAVGSPASLYASAIKNLTGDMVQAEATGNASLVSSLQQQISTFQNSVGKLPAVSASNL